MTIESDLFAMGVDPYWKISDCGTWRYLFGCRWDKRRAVALFILLNPSMGEPKKFDPTMKKCIGFARRWHLGGFEIINPFAFRTSDPATLWRQDFARAVGPGNNEAIREALLSRPARVIAGWGGGSRLLDQRLAQLAPVFVEAAARGGARFEALRVSPGGDPWHPLYVPYSAQPQPFKPSAWA